MPNLLMLNVDEGHPEPSIYELPADHPLMTCDDSVELGYDETPELMEIYDELRDEAKSLDFPQHIDRCLICFYY